jgi:hypothetical protein
MDQLEKDLSSKNIDKVFFVSMLGGDLPGRVLHRLPTGSEMMVIGSLTNKDLVLPASTFYLENKQIRGFFLD